MGLPRLGLHVRVAAGCFLSLALIAALVTLLTNQEWGRQTAQAEHKADEFLRISRQFCADQVRERAQAAGLIREQLQAEAAHLATQAEMQLQTALVEFRSDWLQRQTQAARENNAALRARLVKTNETLEQLQEKNSRFSRKKKDDRTDEAESKNPDAKSDAIADAKDAKTEKSSQAEVLLPPFPELTLNPSELNELSAALPAGQRSNTNDSGATPVKPTPSVLDALDQIRTNGEKESSGKHENADVQPTARTDGIEKDSESSADDVETIEPADDAALAPVAVEELPEDWPVQAARQKSEQIQRMLPAGSSIEVLSGDTPVLVTGQAATDRSDATAFFVDATRPMAFKAGDAVTRWQIRVRISSDAVELYPHSDLQMAGLLTKRLSSLIGLRGFLLDKDGAVTQLYGADPDEWGGISENTAPAVWVESGDYAVLLKTEAALPPGQWNFAAQTKIPLQTDLALALSAASRQPLWVVLLLPCILPFVWVVWGLFVRAGSASAADTKATARVVPAGGSSVQPAAEGTLHRQPTLGSLKRLQQQHRSASTSSGILEHARSAVLKELARKVRPRPVGAPMPNGSVADTDKRGR